jgi:hypothetical protein
MRVYGLDFTSAPTNSKPITQAICQFDGEILDVVSLQPIRSWQEFALFLSEPGSWIAGIDFPFGQPERLIENLNLPKDWTHYVRKIAGLSKSEFRDLIDNYRAGVPDGEEREHKRAIDYRVGSLSPMKIYGIPTGKMFHQGAPFLLASPCRVVPFLQNESTESTVLEAYPGLVVRKFIGKRSYKKDTVKLQTEDQRIARHDTVAAITSEDENSNSMIGQYGFRVTLPDDLRNQCIADPSGDKLDSVLSAIQAAWAYLQRDSNFGVPLGCNLLEGWIPDPSTKQTCYYRNANVIRSISDAVPLFGTRQFNSPTRSTIPMLSLLIHAPKKFTEIIGQLGMPPDSDLHLEYTVSPPQGEGGASQTDIMVKSDEGSLAIEAKWTEKLYGTVEAWLPTVDELNGPVVLNGWLEILGIRATKELITSDFSDVINQMIHRAASAVVSGGDSKLAYFLFKPSPDLQAASTNSIKTELTSLWTKLGKPKNFPFYVVEITMSELPAYVSLRDLPKCAETSVLVRTALQCNQPLFDFQKYRVVRIGEQV